MLWKQDLERIGTKLVGNIFSHCPSGRQRSLASQLCIFPGLLTQAVYYAQSLIYQIQLKPS